MKSTRTTVPIVASLFCFFGLITFANAATVDGTYGDTTVITGPDSQPAWQLSSVSGGAGYAGVYIAPLSLTVSMLTELSANYVMTTGTFGGGAPRFSIIDTTNNTNNEAYVYFGTPIGGGSFTDPNNGNTTYANTGNYADLLSLDVRVYNNGFGGMGNGNTGETWAQFVNDVGSTQIGYITIDLDGGFTGNQVMDLGSFDVNGVDFSPEAAVPEPATWMGAILTAGSLAGVAFRRNKARPVLAG